MRADRRRNRIEGRGIEREDGRKESCRRRRRVCVRGKQRWPKGGAPPVCVRCYLWLPWGCYWLADAPTDVTGVAAPLRLSPVPALRRPLPLLRPIHPARGRRATSLSPVRHVSIPRAFTTRTPRQSLFHAFDRVQTHSTRVHLTTESRLPGELSSLPLSLSLLPFNAANTVNDRSSRSNRRRNHRVQSRPLFARE